MLTIIAFNCGNAGNKHENLKSEIRILPSKFKVPFISDFEFIYSDLFVI
jgi:hypothetical protein